MLLTELQTRIATALSFTPEVQVFRRFMPESPDVCVTIYASGGSAGTRAFGDDVLQYENPSVQVVARGAKYDGDGPEAMVQAIIEDFISVGDEDLSSTRYLLVDHINGPFTLRRDDLNRVYIAANFRVMKEPS
jgi:hypothetical protein